MTELEAIAATRFLFGLGAGLLLSHYLPRPQRCWVGWGLVALGALSTPPLIYDVYQNRAHE